MTLPVDLVARISDLIAAGRVYTSVASELGIKTTTVGYVVRSRGIVRPKAQGYVRRGTKVSRSEARLRQMQAAGATAFEAAAATGLSYHSVSGWARKTGIAFRRPNIGVSDPDRLAKAVELYKAGFTLNQIGQQMGVSRERIRQLLSKYAGVTAQDGGATVKNERQRAKRQARKDAKTFARWGCTYEQWRALRDLGLAMQKQGVGRYRTPLYAYRGQENNARLRGIPFRLTLWEWWNVWQASGHWEDRGRGRGYMMCRIADEGAYELGNVFITTGCENTRDGRQRIGGKRYRPQPEQVRQALELARVAA